jgi:hypothetical protein
MKRNFFYKAITLALFATALFAISCGDPGPKEDLPPPQDKSKLVVTNPSFTLGGGITENNDGTYRLATKMASDNEPTNGFMDYEFPFSNANKDNLPYDYFIILTKILSNESGSGTGIQLKTYGTSNGYTGGDQNKMPWLSNGDGKKILLEVSGAGTTKGFRIYIPDQVRVERLEITSITFYKAPRYKVTFDYNYEGGPKNKSVSNVWGKDDNHNGYGVGAVSWPDAPDRTTGSPPYWFLGWFDDEDNLFTSSTPITANITLKANWASSEPTKWMEQITNNATCAPLYAFEIPTGEKLGDYSSVTIFVKGNASGRFRAWGTYPTTIYTESNFPLKSNSTIVNMQNADNGLLLTNTAGGVDNLVLDGEDWSELTLYLTIGRHDTYGTASGLPGKWDDNATGIQLLALGLVPPQGGNGLRTYLIKNITLNKPDNGGSIPALDPRDNKLWNGKGETAFVQQSGSGPTTRTIIMYADD